MRPSCAQVMGVALLFFFLFSASSMAQDCNGKRSWPELVGRAGSTAAAIIKAQNPNVKMVKIVPQGSGVPRDFHCERVFVWVRANGIIYLVPAVG